MALYTDKITFGTTSTQYGGFTTAATQMLQTSLLNTVRAKEDALVGTDFDSEYAEPTSEELASIEDAEKEIDLAEKLMEEHTNNIRTLEEELEELNREYKKLTSQYESETDPDKQQGIMDKIDDVSSQITSKITDINIETQLFKNVEQIRTASVEKYETAVETVNNNLKQRSEEAKLIAARNTASQYATPDSFGLNGVPLVNANAENFKQYGYNAERGAKLGAAAINTANRLNSRGWCYRGVIQSLAKIGVTGLTGGSAYMAANQLAARSDFKEIKVSRDDLKKLPAGAVVVWNRTADGSKPHGHISISLGDGRESSDHINNQYNSCGDGTFRVFLPV